VSCTDEQKAVRNGKRCFERPFENANEHSTETIMRTACVTGVDLSCKADRSGRLSDLIDRGKVNLQFVVSRASNLLSSAAVWPLVVHHVGRKISDSHSD